jgi:hypothetical protein
MSVMLSLIITLPVVRRLKGRLERCDQGCEGLIRDRTRSSSQAQVAAVATCAHVLDASKVQPLTKHIW